MIQRLSYPKSSVRWTALVTVSFLAIYWLTLTQFVGDTQVYVHDILTARASGNLSPLFEFGHVLWRPLGYALFRVLSWADSGANDRVLVNTALLVLNLVGGLVCALLLFRIATIVSGSRRAGFVTTLALVCANSFLNYAESGSSYIAALALFTTSVWLLLREPMPARAVTVVLAGVALAGAVLLWFPFVTVAPGVAAIVLFWTGRALLPEQRERRRRVLLGIQLTVTTALVTLAVYYIAFRIAGHANVSEVGGWIRESTHGWHQTSNAVRFVFGFPRSFLDLGNDGVLFKRFLWHDPYARVSVAELIRGSLLKIAVFYAVLAYVFLRLAADGLGRIVLIVVTAALIPLLFFAIILFEPGSPERYLPLFPFAAMAIAFAICRPGTRVAQIALTWVLIVSAADMLWSHSVWQLGTQDRRFASELQALKSAANDKSVAWVLLPTDPLLGYAIIRPVDPVNVDRPLQIQYLVEAGMENAREWPQKFARLSLRAWDQQGRVLVTNQVLAPRPERGWNWTEGDIPGVHWTDFPAFFSRLEHRPGTPGGDGFFEVTTSEGNRRLLEVVLAQPVNADSKEGRL